MPDQTAMFVNALIARFGDRAHPCALEQVSLATAGGMQDSALSWAMIADGIVSLPGTAPPTAPVLIESTGAPLHATDGMALRQLLYVSVATHQCDEDDLAAILRASRDLNVMYSVTGILWSDGQRFIQALEGPIASVEETYARILTDKRHHSLLVIYDHLVEKRDFGSWSMCHRRSYETDDEYDQKIKRALAAAPGPVRATIHAFIGGGVGAPIVTASWAHDGSSFS